MKSNLCGYNNNYILVSGDIVVGDTGSQVAYVSQKAIKQQ